MVALLNRCKNGKQMLKVLRTFQNWEETIEPTVNVGYEDKFIEIPLTQIVSFDNRLSNRFY